MSCSPFDLRDYLLRELAEPQRRQVDAHVQACPSCRLELDRLRLTQTALSCLRDEEIPQRIGLGFASAAMLSVALIFSLVTRPAPAPRLVETARTVSENEIRQRIEAGVERAVATIETRYAQRTEQLVKDIRLRDQEERRAILAVANIQIDYLDHRLQAAKRSQYVASVSDGGTR